MTNDNNVLKTPRVQTYSKLVAKHAALEAKIKEARKFVKLVAQSEALAAQIAEARAAELTTIVWPKITAILIEYDMSKAELLEYAKTTAGYLRSKGGAPVAASKKVRAPSKAVAVKYTDGTHVWTGRGLTPRWLKDALAANPSFTKEGFMIKN